MDAGHSEEAMRDIRSAASASRARRVLHALERSERTALSATLPMRRIATATLGGNDDLAAKVLTDSTWRVVFTRTSWAGAVAG